MTSNSISGASRTHRRWRLHWDGHLAALLGALVLVAVLWTGAPASGARAGLRAGGTGAPTYVALGDSFTSSPLSGDVARPAGCLRSADDYPHQVARAFGFNLIDVSCSGATTADMTGPEVVGSSGVAPQLDAVTPADAVVSLGVGGDDLGFSKIVAHCVAATPWGPTPVGWSCRSHYDAGGHDLLEAQIAAAAPRVGTVLDDIHRRAPRATVFVMGYPDIVPSSGTGCWPLLPFTRADLPYLASVEVDLNTMLRGVAVTHGATFVDVYGPSESHNACAPESTRWVQPLSLGDGALPLHPDAAGVGAMAGLLGSAMRRDDVGPPGPFS